MTVAAVCCCRKIKRSRFQDRNRPLSWVELVRRYSNRADLQERLAQARSKSRRPDGQQHEAPGLSWGRTPGTRQRVRDRLTDADIELLIADFLAGTSKRVLAERYEISFSSVKRILRKHGVRRANQVLQSRFSAVWRRCRSA
jgi:DNA invertase Pin-like site-specific DNA recombinase